MLKAVKDAGLMQLPCFAHTLNLIVTGAIKANVGIESVLENGRKLVKFFNKSSLANSKLVEQADIAAKSDHNLHIRKLKKDVKTS